MPNMNENTVVYNVKILPVEMLSRHRYYELVHVHGYCPILKAVANINVKDPSANVAHPYERIQTLVEDVVEMAAAQGKLADIVFQVEAGVDVEDVEQECRNAQVDRIAIAQVVKGMRVAVQSEGMHLVTIVYE